MPQIRWSKGDAIKLGRAVAEFNKTINKLQTEENKLYLPDLKNYQEIKQNIYTRQELNRILRSLKRIKKENALDLYTTQAGETLTRYERAELGYMSAAAQRRITRELKEFKTAERPYKTAEERTLEAQRKNLRKIEQLQGADFRRLKQRIENVGKSDFSYRRALQFQLNYLKEMEKYKGFKNYNILQEKLESFRDPEAFYNFVKDKDLLVDLTYQSDEQYSEERFNWFVQQWYDDSYFEMPDTISDFHFSE